jgi:hypothetical protein
MTSAERKIYLIDAISVADVGVRKEVLRVRAEVIRPVQFIIEALVVNTRASLNASVFERACSKSRTLAVSLAEESGRWFINKPIIPMTVEQWDSLVALMDDMEEILAGYCEQNGFTLIPSRRYTERSFRAWFIKMPHGGVRVGCPFLVHGRAFWITAVKNGVDITEKTKKEVNAWVGYAPRYRIYHNNRAVARKVLEVVEYYRKKICE